MELVSFISQRVEILENNPHAQARATKFLNVSGIRFPDMISMGRYFHIPHPAALMFF